MDQLSQHWAADNRSAESRKALRSLAAAEPVVAAVGASDLGELVRWLRAGASPVQRTSDRARSAAVLRAMLRSQGVHPLLPRAVLQALLPGLVGVARRLDWGAGGEWADGGAFFVDVITTAWEVIVEWAGEDREYAVLDLLSAVRCRLRRQLLRHRAVVERTAPVPDDDATSVDPWRTGGSGLDELARAIDEATGNGLESTDASVLYAHRVLGYSLTELSQLTGRSRRYLSERRDRAARALIA
jgi:hypothetical protein